MLSRIRGALRKPGISWLFDGEPTHLGSPVAVPKHPVFDKLDEILAEEVDLSTQNDDGDTPLHLAVRVALGYIIGDTPTLVMMPNEEVEVMMPTQEELASALDNIMRSRFPAPMLEAAQRVHNRVGVLPLHIAVQKNKNRHGRDVIVYFVVVL